MSIAKYRKMRVKSWDRINKEDWPSFTSEMRHLCGRTVAVMSPFKSKWAEGTECFHYDEWTLRLDWLEPVNKITLNTKKLY